MKSLYSYRDYRDILRDLYTEEKSRSPQYGYATFAKKAGLGSPNYLKLVMDGDRNLTTTNIQAFAKSMDFADNDIQFFEALVLENQSKTPLEKRYYARRVSQLKKSAKNEGGIGVSRSSPSELLESSLKIAVLLLVSGRPQSDAQLAIESEFGISKSLAKNYLDQLMSSGELKLNDADQFVLSASHRMMSDAKNKNERLRLYLKEGVEENIPLFAERYLAGTAKFLSVFASAAEGSLPEMFKDLRLALESVTEKYDPLPHQSKAVYRIQLQAYRYKKNLE